MMSKCANPKCSSVLHYLRDGKLFQVPAEEVGQAKAQRSTTHDEFFWLCGHCSQTLTLKVQRSVGVRVVPRTPEREMRAAAS